MQLIMYITDCSRLDCSGFVGEEVDRQVLFLNDL